jgi:putative transposase
VLNRHLPQRKSPRLKGYDYRQDGAYFVTIVTYLRQSVFGQVRDGEIYLSQMGEIARSRLLAIPDHHPHVILDAFVVMPNHVHAIVAIVNSTLVGFSDKAGLVPTGNSEGRKKPALSGSVSTVIGSYKSSVTRLCQQQGHIDDSGPLWQSLILGSHYLQ